MMKKHLNSKYEVGNTTLKRLFIARLLHFLLLNVVFVIHLCQIFPQIQNTMIN